jgi:hypothetical protein
MQTFFKRLLIIVENQGFKNLNDFALNGLKYESSSKLNRLKDEKNKPSIEILTDIANKFQNINLHWLITGSGSMFLDDDIILNSNASESNNLRLETYNLLLENNKLQSDAILLLKEKVEILEDKLQDCESEKKLQANVIKVV